MKSFFKDAILYRNIFWLFYIACYFAYVAVNMHLNRGNYIINVTLLVLTCAYFLLYIYSAFIDKNRKIKNQSKRAFIRTRKTLAFINACMILTSVISNNNNSFTTIFLAIITILWYVLYLFVDIASTVALSSFRKFNKGALWKHDNRD